MQLTVGSEEVGRGQSSSDLSVLPPGMTDVSLDASFDTNKRNYNAVQKMMDNTCAELEPEDGFTKSLSRTIFFLFF